MTTTTSHGPLSGQARIRAARFEVDLRQQAAFTGLSPDDWQVWANVEEKWLCQAEAADPAVPCPYDWCEEGPTHHWGHQLHVPDLYACGRDERFHSRTVHEAIDVVAREVDPGYGESDPGPWVHVHDVELRDREAAMTFLRAMVEAAQTSWPGFADELGLGK